MKKLLALNKPVPGPGTYSSKSVITTEIPEFKPVVVNCFFKGADKCTLCGTLLYGDYYKDSRKKRALCWCLSCFRFSIYAMPRTYLESVKKHRHCSFVHKHIDVENIVYSLIPEKRVRKMLLMEKAMWNKYGEIRDHRGCPM